MRDRLRRHPATAFYVLVFALTWGMGALQLVPTESTTGALVSAIG